MKAITNKKHSPRYCPLEALRAEITIVMGVDQDHESALYQTLSIVPLVKIKHGFGLALDLGTITIPWSKLKEIRKRKN
jgi:hypothetical protein